MNVKSLKNVNVTVPESLRAMAANENTFGVSSESSSSGKDKMQSAGKRKRDNPSRESSAQDSSQDKAAVDSKQQIVKFEPVPAEDHGDVPLIDIDAQIRESSVPDKLFDAKNRFSKIESRIALSAFAFIVVALAASWLAWDKDYAIVGNADTAYNYGLVGGLMMLVILTYALRKRSRTLRKLGDIKYWYYFHFIFGIVGPVLIVLHTSFGIRSINGGVALFAMFSIVFSGFIGRYIYTRASYGLRMVEQDLQVVTRQLEKGVLSYNLKPLKTVEEQLRAFSRDSLSAPKGIIKMISRILLIKHKAKLVYAATWPRTSSIIRAIAIKEKWTKGQYRERALHEKRLIQGHLSAVSNIASSRAFEKLASKWRLLHVPILYVLVLSGLAHVLAVHMY